MIWVSFYIFFSSNAILLLISDIYNHLGLRKQIICVNFAENIAVMWKINEYSCMHGRMGAAMLDASVSPRTQEVGLSDRPIRHCCCCVWKFHLILNCTESDRSTQ